MHIAVFGAGYVGLTSAACFAHMGHNVALTDVNAARLDALRRGECPIFEEGLEELLKNPALRYVDSAKDALHNANVALIAAGTPHDPSSGATDMRQVFAVASDIAEHATDAVTVVTKSTVPTGTARRLQRFFDERRRDIRIECASNPEFLREGRAVEDFLKPDRIVVGADSDKALADCAALYKPLTDAGYRLYRYGSASAETIKYASNGFLAVKIAYINEMADFCERTGANIDDVAEGMGADSRIGAQFLRAGPGYGGSCFPKDTESLRAQAWRNGSDAHIVNAAIGANAKRPAALLDHAKQRLAGGDWRGKRIGLLGAAFKGDTDDVRESPALKIAKILYEDGAKLAICDPQAIENAKRALPSCDAVTYGTRWQDAAKNADIVIIATEWKEFSAIAPQELASLMQENGAVYDMRNMLNGSDVRAAGLQYMRVGEA